MPTTIAQHDAFDRTSGRWRNFRDIEAVEAVTTRAALWGAVALAALVLCVACLASGLHPAPVNATDFADLLSP